MNNSILRDNGVAPHLSSRYVRVDTAEVVRTLEADGFKLVGVRQDRVRARDPRWSRHELDFRHPELDAKPLSDGTVPRVLFINSHNGTTRARFLVGAFRFVCTNGLIVGSTLGDERVRHMGDSARTIIDRIREQSKAAPALFERLGRWERTKLSRAAQLDLATKALELRFGEGAAQRYQAADLLVPQRQEDERDDLWHVFNRIQENGTRTRLIGHNAQGRRVQARGIANISADHAWNQGLWRLAAEVAEA